MTTRPFYTALQAAITGLDIAQEAYDDHKPEKPIGVPESPEWEQEDARLARAVDEARRAIEDARDALRDSDESREWKLREKDYVYDTVFASSATEALAIAQTNVDRGNYGDSTDTLYIDISVSCTDTGEEDSETVTLEPVEPDCLEGEEHDWRSPYSVLGGIEENPGVWGHGGGVIIKQVCAHCGRYQITDTWAQRRDTGEQGLTEVSYEDADDDSLAWLTRRQCKALVDALSNVIDNPKQYMDGDRFTRVITEEEDTVDPEQLLEEVQAVLPSGWGATLEYHDERGILLEINRD